MEDIVNQSLLYDFYGELLTKHQRRIYEEVVFNDYSISEVARDEGISRQGISDLIRRCDKLLQGYEEKLGLVNKFEQTKHWYSKYTEFLQSFMRPRMIV